MATKKELVRNIIDEMHMVYEETNTLNAAIVELGASGYLADANLLMPHTINLVKELGDMAAALNVVVVAGRRAEEMTELEVQTIRMFGNLGNGTSITDAYNAVNQVVEEARKKGGMDPRAEAVFTEITNSMEPKVRKESGDLFSDINRHLGM